MNLLSIDRTDIYLCLFLFGFLALCFTGFGTSVDENLIVQTVESLATKGELTVDRMYQALQGPDGQYYSRYGITFPLLMLPFYYVGMILDMLFPESVVFFKNPYFFMMLWGNLLITVLTGWGMYRLCLAVGGNKKGAVALSLGLIIATPFWLYAQTLYRLTAATAVLIFVLIAVLNHLKSHSKTSLILLILLVAAGLNLREDLVIAFAFMGLYSIGFGNKKERLERFMAFFLGGLLGFLIWGFHNFIRFGAFFIENYADLNFNYPLIVSIPGLLIGERTGLITYAPLSLLLIIALPAVRRNKQWSLWVMCFLILGSYFLLYGKSDFWHGGQCWGPRHMYFLLPFAMLPGIWLFEQNKSWFFGLFVLLFCGGVIMNWPGIYAHHGKFISFFASPSFFELLWKPIVHPDYVTFDEMDLWWIRQIKMYGGWWYVGFTLLVVLCGIWGYGLYKSLNLTRVIDHDTNIQSNK